MRSESGTRPLFVLLVMGLALCAACRFSLSGTTVDGGEPDSSPDLSVVVDGNVGQDVKPTLDLFGYDGAPAGKIGHPCLEASDCDNGLCVTGFCCDSLCDPVVDANKCRACNVPGAEGHCVFALEGTDPRGRCVEDAPASCGQDGLCDGKGGCRKWTRGTVCGASSCGTLTNLINYAPACDGNGDCVPSSTLASCAPYACKDATSCSTSCGGASGGSCVAAPVCMGGSCGKRAIGQPCAAASDCATNFCAQGVCCQTACTANCQSCAVGGHLGKCVPVPAGTDPLGQCISSPQEGCGLDGTCDGAGGCRNWKLGTPCKWPACIGDAVTILRTCDGVGACLTPSPSTTSCGSFSCDPYAAACHVAPCHNNAECASGKTCDAMTGNCN